MTTIKFIKKNSNYVALKMIGHTGYGEYGNDILCSSISSIAQAGALGILKVLNVNADIVKDEKIGLFEIQLKDSLDENTQEKVNVLFETMKVSFEDLRKGYKKFLKLEEVCDDVY